MAVMDQEKMLKHKPQICSYCKRKIYHDADRKNKIRSDECVCSNRGVYYIPSNIKTDYSGLASYDESKSMYDYYRTLIDQLN